MAIARITGNYWKLPRINGIDTIYDPSCDDIIPQYAEYDAVITAIDCNASFGKGEHDIASKDSSYDAWDSFEELYDDSNDWLAEFNGKHYISDGNE